MHRQESEIYLAKEIFTKVAKKRGIDLREGHTHPQPIKKGVNLPKIDLKGAVLCIHCYDVIDQLFFEILCATRFSKKSQTHAK
jgi:hypothetical protein